MKDFPHRYVVRVSGGPEGNVQLDSPGLPTLESATPAEFDGPGDRWSPETLLVASVADCVLLTFRAMARASHLAWHELALEGMGVLDRDADGKLRFTEVQLRAHLKVPAGTNEERARRILAKAEEACMISRSLLAQVHLESEIASG